MGTNPQNAEAFTTSTPQSARPLPTGSGWRPDTKKMALLAPADLCDTLNLTRIPDERAIAPDQIEAEQSKKVVSILRTARNLAMANFPLLTQEEWVLLLNCTDYWSRSDRDMVLSIATHPRERSFLISELSFYLGENEGNGLDLTRLRNIGPNETHSILLVSEHFWMNTSESPLDLREILSRVSGRPKECVFFDDPNVEDLWKVAKITLSDETEGTVTFTYAGQEMATLEFRASDDKNTVTFGTLSCADNRPLVRPEQDLRSTLTQIAIHEVFAVLS